MAVFSVFFYEVVLCTFVLRDENAIGSECVCVCVCGIFKERRCKILRDSKQLV
jgi:limonene-1,2-epoxide hydrolase